MPDTTARLGLPIMAPAQAQKHVTHNEALLLLDGATQLVLDGIGTNSPPSTPVSGETHFIGAAPSGVWAQYAGALRNGRTRNGSFKHRKPDGALGMWLGISLLSMTQACGAACTTTLTVWASGPATMPSIDCPLRRRRACSVMLEPGIK
nr:DUF2793 domain-containing protein [Cognatishimia maritima]